MHSPQTGKFHFSYYLAPFKQGTYLSCSTKAHSAHRTPDRCWPWDSPEPESCINRPRMDMKTSDHTVRVEITLKSSLLSTSSCLLFHNRWMRQTMKQDSPQRGNSKEQPWKGIVQETTKTEKLGILQLYSRQGHLTAPENRYQNFNLSLSYCWPLHKAKKILHASLWWVCWWIHQSFMITHSYKRFLILLFSL